MAMHQAAKQVYYQPTVGVKFGVAISDGMC